MFPKEEGLATEEAQRQLGQWGLNILPERPPPGEVSLFVSQLGNPLVSVLLLASAASVVIRHFSDAVIILAAVALNTVLGYLQERKANKALFALKKLLAPRAEVIRDGRRIKTDASLLVPGDQVILVQGAKVPADGEIVYANRLYLDEAIISGESLPVSKKRAEKVFMGTTVVSGQALVRLETTGARTKMGRIAQKIQEVKEETPLKKQLANFSQRLVVLIGGLTSFTFIIGVLRGKELTEMFTVAVALAVSSIPEGLLVSLTVVLAIGMQRILKRHGLVRKLSSAETLGGITTICVDKTGTLTEGKMQVVDFVGDREKLAQQVILANDLDDPIMIAAFVWGREIIKNYLQEHPRLDSLPFSPRERFFASLNQWTESANVIFVNGAPDFLLEWSSVTDKEKEKIQKTITELSSQGKRLIGFARKKVSADKTLLEAKDAKDNLTWVGILAFSDPVRTGVKEAIGQAMAAGIKTTVITGDYPRTSESVLKELGITLSQKETMIGSELQQLTVEQLSDKVKSVRLFARTTPEQKLMIVEALKRNGEIVAMMGDGVNDAPALHQADIGIVVGEASDVARESADLVLLDSNFATVVAAVEEGRGMFENIRKIILYLLSDAFGEILVVIGSIILGLPLPITAVQILWINLISDGFPDLALTLDPKRQGIMSEKPRPARERLVNRWMMALISLVSLVSGAAAFSLFLFVLRQTNDIAMARSAAFITLGLNSLVYVFPIRTLMTPFWRNHLFENKWLIGAVLAGLGLQVLPFLTAELRQFFGVGRLNINYWLIAGLLSLPAFILVEVFKLVSHFKNTGQNLLIAKLTSSE
jgi:Ca2+-transporting ATPase